MGEVKLCAACTREVSECVCDRDTVVRSIVAAKDAEVAALLARAEAAEASMLSLWRFLTGDDAKAIPEGKRPCGYAIVTIRHLRDCQDIGGAPKCDECVACLKSEAARLAGVVEGGVGLIAAERRRQVEAEGWTPEHDDDEHDSGQLAQAAACYAMPPAMRKSSMMEVPGSTRSPSTVVPVARGWPWEPQWWKPSPNDRIRELTKAGALIAAEIDRLQRAAAAAKGGQGA